MIKSIFDIDIVADFCESEIQKLPFCIDYAKRAMDQIRHYLDQVDISSVSQTIGKYVNDIFRSMHDKVYQVNSHADTLISIYQDLRILVILLLVHHYCFEVKSYSLFSRLEVCLQHLNAGDFNLGIDMSEAALASSI